MSDAEKIQSLVDQARVTDSMDECVCLLIEAHRLTIATEETLDPALVETVVVDLNDAQALRHQVVKEAVANRDPGPPELQITEERMAELRAENERDRAEAEARRGIVSIPSVLSVRPFFPKDPQP